MTGTASLTPNTGMMSKFGMRAAFPVEASPLNACAQSMNWILGRGTPLVVDGGYWFSSASSAVDRALNYRFFVDGNHPTIGVYIVLHAVDAASLPVDVSVVGVGTTASVTVGSLPSVIHFPLENDVGGGEKNLGINFAFNGNTSSLMIDGLYVYESPVALIENSGVAGVPARTPIYDGYNDYESIAGLERQVEDMRTLYFRKGALYNWASPVAEGLGGVTNSTTTYASLHPDGAKPAIQTRLMYNGETTRNARCNVNANVTGGTGNVRITMASGAQITFNVTATGGVGNGVWHTTQDLAIETNDPSRLFTDGGIRGGTRDTITIEWRASSGQSCRLYGVSIWDRAGD